MPKREKRVAKKSSQVSSRIFSAKLNSPHFSFKFSESYISLILGVLVVIAAAILFFSFSKNRTYDRINTAVSTYQELTTPIKGSSKVKTYTVAAGDNLWSIAEKVYGTGYNWVDLAKANSLKNPGVLFVGTKLTVPNVPRIVVQNSDNSNINGPSITGPTYKIAQGDNLWGIAVRSYGDGYKWSEIARANSIENPDLIYTENVLKLPR